MARSKKHQGRQASKAKKLSKKAASKGSKQSATTKTQVKSIGQKPKHGKNTSLNASERLLAMKKRLDGGKFRILNEQLYTSTGTQAFDLFQEDPALFDVYHQGFREQAEKWPLNPLDVFIGYVKKHPKAIVADFGCGDARLAESVKNKVHSFDLVSRKPHVVACNIADVPLDNESIDIAIYCLALMGTTIKEYLMEVHRVLKPRGVLKVAEVKSRFETESVGGIKGFVDYVTKLGFDLKQQDDKNKMFVLFEFTKSKRKPHQHLEPIELKACEYKRR